MVLKFRKKCKELKLKASKDYTTLKVRKKPVKVME